MESTLTEAELIATNMQSRKAGERLAWLYEQYGDRVVASSSFGLQAAVMLHLISEHAPKIPVVFVDTGYLFKETYEYIEQLKNKLNVDLRTYVPELTAARQEALYGKLWEGGADEQQKYAVINKIEPMNRALREIGGDIWLSGVRRAQSSTRKDRSFAEKQTKTTKVYPILDWADAQVNAYFAQNDLPRHPLEAQGYQTMGDWHSTVPVAEGENAEASRFNGQKYECGLHLDSGVQDFQI
ncbi:phosphoadenylyl-sulfate reductase [Rubritalea squalenifaciens]|nr:phosphoadenylyl-sulfate reductase [Rubritalea squalenifaciens]